MVAACRTAQRGLTLIELLSGLAILILAMWALFSAYTGQTVLNEHSRNRTWAAFDALRVMEEIQRQNAQGICATINVNPPAGFTWDTWLQGPGGGKSIQPNPATEELIVFNPPQGIDPVQVNIAVCWRHRGRVIGDCAWNGAQLLPDANGDGTTTSPVTLTTLITCRA
jgi:type II secretory pathway pseudopilin PulG